MEKWLLADLHIHSTFSDGLLPMEEIVQLYGQSGFDVIAITDHLFDTESQRSLEIHAEGKSVKNIKDYFAKIEEVARWAKKNYDMLVIPGLEVCNLPRDYHILGIDLTEAVNPNQDVIKVLEEIHRQGGVAIASHPPLKLSYFLQGDMTSLVRHPLHLWRYKERYVDKIDAWEIANREDIFGEVSLERFPYLANSDFHDRHHLTSWKSLIYAEKERESIKKAILKRKVALLFFSDKEECIRLPQIIPPNTKVLHHPNDDGKGKNGIKILIADDERDLVEMLTYNLEKRGYEIHKAYDGFDAWKKIEADKPDLLILDLMMPNLDGWELCRLIRQNTQKEIRELSIIMLTAKAMPEDRVYGLQIGADDYLTKPFSIHELLLRVGNLIEKKKSVFQLKEEMESLQSLIHKKEMELTQLVHDLKNPLLSIGASAKRMLRRNQNEEEQKILRMIYDNSLRLTRWVDDTLSFIKIEDEFKEVDIRPLIQQVIDLQKEGTIEKKIEIEFEAPSSMPLIRCHEQLIFRAIENLLNNALKYTPKGGKVHVILTSHGKAENDGKIEISVKDTGIGISKEDVEKIHEPFYRGNNAPKKIGTGLGLTFVKQVVDLHGGRISIQSELKKGSTFSIIIPVGRKLQN